MDHLLLVQQCLSVGKRRLIAVSMAAALEQWCVCSPMISGSTRHAKSAVVTLAIPGTAIWKHTAHCGSCDVIVAEETSVWLPDHGYGAV